MADLRVFLADDHAVVREGLKALVNGAPGMVVCGEASDGLSACEQVERLLPDVAVMDVSMPGLGGAEATARLKLSCPQVKVLALTVHEDRGYLRLMLEAGAVGYVLTRSAAEDLVRAIKAVADGGTYIDPALAGSVVGPFAGRPPEPTAELSDREAEVVKLIARGYSNKEIASRLALSVKTVETYKARSLEKLKVRTRVGLVQFAADRGWLSTP